MKKFLRSICAIILLASISISAVIPAYAESPQGENSSSLSNEYTVTGTNSFGNMVA